MELLTTKEIAEQWNISARRVALLCEEGRLEGAVKKGKTWLIPIDVEKPEDGRYKRMKTYYEKFVELEKKYKVIYPESDNATYTSLLNYSDDLNKPYQRWYRYKEGFSVELVKHLINIQRGLSLIRFQEVEVHCLLRMIWDILEWGLRLTLFLIFCLNANWKHILNKKLNFLRKSMKKYFVMRKSVK